MITNRQIAAARALLGWSAVDLAAKAGLSDQTIRSAENGEFARSTTLAKIEETLTRYGIEFTDGNGVKNRARDVEVFEGIDRFEEFYEFLYDHMERNGGDICLSVVNEHLFREYRKDFDLHAKRIKAIAESGQVTFRVLATEGYFDSVFAEHRWQPAQSSSPTAFYAFGECLALITFAHNPAPYVILIKSGPMAESYRASFNAAWENAPSKPPKGRKK